MKHLTCLIHAIMLLMLVAAAAAQTSLTSTTPASAQIPHLIRFSGIARDEAGQPMTGVLNVRFALYQDERGGAPLWLETQNVQADGAGHYTALLGSATTDGVPLDLFSSAAVHWMGVQAQGERHGNSGGGGLRGQNAFYIHRQTCLFEALGVAGSEIDVLRD